MENSLCISPIKWVRPIRRVHSFCSPSDPALCIPLKYTLYFCSLSKAWALLQPLPLSSSSISFSTITIQNVASRARQAEPTWRRTALDDIDCLSKWDIYTVTLCPCWPRIIAISLPDHPTSLSSSPERHVETLTGSQETLKLANRLRLSVW